MSPGFSSCHPGTSEHTLYHLEKEQEPLPRPTRFSTQRRSMPLSPGKEALPQVVSGVNLQ